MNLSSSLLLSSATAKTREAYHSYDYFRLEIYVDAEHGYYSSCGTILDKEPFVG
jgi:hypothetical protein